MKASDRLARRSGAVMRAASGRAEAEEGEDTDPDGVTVGAKPRLSPKPSGRLAAQAPPTTKGAFRRTTSALTSEAKLTQAR